MPFDYEKNWSPFGLAIVGGLLYLTSLYHYLLFHAFAEFFSIAVAFAFFLIVWSARKNHRNSYIIFIGIAYFFVGILDMLHTLAYEGMHIFTDYDYYANQLWIAARFLESSSLLAGFLFLGGRRRLNPLVAFALYLVITVALLGSIFVWKIFPECYVAGRGLTPFKKISEYVICAILVLDIVLMVRAREKFSEKVYLYLAWALFLTIGSELAFTFYVSNYGLSNLVGHYFKLFSFYCIYKAIVETCLTDPFHTLFLDLKANEKALRGIRDNLEEAQRIAHLGSWTYQIEGNKLFWSDETYRIFGLAPRGVGATYEAFLAAVHPGDREAVDGALGAAIRNEAPYAIEHRVVRPDGSERVVRTQAEVFFDARDRPARMVGTVQDITERKEAEGALAVRLRYEKGLTDCSRVLLSAAGAAGAVDQVLNRCLESLLHASGASRVYLFENFEDPADGPCMRQRYEACADGVTPEIDNPELQHLPYEPYFGRWRRELQGGSLISGPVTAFPEGERRVLEPQGILSILVLPVFVQGGWYGFVGFDDTECVRPWRDEDIRLLWMTAEMIGGYLSLRRMQEELTEARDAAEDANRAKSVFLANMSHEVRTPMNAVLGMNQLALKVAVEPRQRRYLEIVEESANSLLGVLNDILDFSKMEAGQLVVESVPFELRGGVDAVMRTLAVKAQEKGLELVCHLAPDLPAVLEGDPLRLRQILINLVGNAVKFTEQGYVAVRGEVVGEEAGELVLLFSVEDTGVGIPAERREKIFERFSQVDSSMARRHGGSGLGLSICRRLVELMGGRIWVSDGVDGGVTFNFTIRSRRGAVETEPFALPGFDFSSLPVLVAAAHPLCRRGLAETFGSWGFPVITAADGGEVATALAGAEAAGCPVRLLVAEPACLAAGSARAVDRPVVIALVAVGDRGGDGQGSGLAADFSLAKPVGRDELRGVVEAALTGRPFVADADQWQPATDRWTPLRVLLAEDIVANQELARVVLEEAGHAVVCVDNGVEVLGALAADTFDVVIMDVQMPRMDGLAATAVIRRCERDEPAEEGNEHASLIDGVRRRLAGRRLPILAMTAHAMSGDRERCLAEGMDGYITKPFVPREVFALLEKLAGREKGGVGERAASRQPGAMAAVPASREQARQQLRALYSLPDDKIDFLLDSSVGQVAERLDELTGMLDAGNRNGVVLAAHSLVGLLANLGFAEWSAVARRIEKASEQDDQAGDSAAWLQELRVGLAPLK